MLPEHELSETGETTLNATNGDSAAGAATAAPASGAVEANRTPLKTRAARVRQRERSAPVYERIEVAAAKLSLDVGALRARCRRAARADGDRIVAPLGGGIVAIKFGRTWRIRFPGAPS